MPWCCPDRTANHNRPILGYTYSCRHGRLVVVVVVDGVCCCQYCWGFVILSFTVVAVVVCHGNYYHGEYLAGPSGRTILFVCVIVVFVLLDLLVGTVVSVVVVWELLSQ
mmetsp:Transcript_41603/g.45144  ORF Transcript_41603/g.45144 Transcript_41603/m.45144 type:complete len:109 (+) Transcript_41603:149-475(+)